MSQIARQLKLEALRAMKSGEVNTAEVRVDWMIHTGTHNPNEESSSARVRTPGTGIPLPHPLVFFVTPAEVERRGYVVITVGDVIVDFLAGELEKVLPGDAKEITFTIKDKTYVQKDTADETEEWHDLVVGDEEIFRTLLLNPSNKSIPVEVASPMLYPDGTAMLYPDGTPMLYP